MESNKKILLTTIFIAVVIVALVGVTFAFFNYTRTGSSNVIKVGRIYFNTEQNSTINLDNAFPIDKTKIDNDTDNVGSVSIHITGDTTYSDGIEYLVSAVNVNNSVDTKKLPISINVDYEETNNKDIGILDSDYFDNRGDDNSRYKIISNRITVDNSILVGYIKPDNQGIDGTITIKAYIDKDKVAISDTYPERYESLDLNPTLSSSEINGCISYMNQAGYDYYLQTGETMESFCDGTGTIYGKDIYYWISHSWFYDDDIENLINMHVLIGTLNGTGDDWVKGRTVLTTTQWNSLHENGISFQIKVEANEGIWVESKGNAMQFIPSSIKSTYGSGIKKIHFKEMSSSAMQSAYEEATVKEDITYNDEGIVLAWLEENEDDNTKYNLIIASDGDTYLTAGDGLFNGMTGVESIVFDNVNTSRVTTMNGMFAGCSNLKSINVSSFDTSNVTNMSSMFGGCSNLQSVNLDNFDTSNVTNMSGLFSGCTKLETISMNNQGSDLLANISGFVGGCSNLKTVNMQNFNFGSVTSLQSVFSYKSYLETVNLSNAKTNYVTDMSGMFSNSSSLKHVNISHMGSSSLTSVSGMFSDCFGLIDVDMSYFNFGSVQSISFIFISSANTLETVDLSNSNMRGLNNFSFTFDGLENLQQLNLTNVEVSNIVSLQAAFRNCKKLTYLDLSGFDTSSVTATHNAFQNCEKLETIYVSSLWNMDLVTYSSEMFSGCTSLVGGNNTHYSVSNPTDKTYARIDTTGNPGYFTLKTN